MHTNERLHGDTMATGQQLVDKGKDDRERIKKLTAAFNIWSKEDPESFRKVAPDLLRLGVDRASGANPRSLRRLENWLTNEWLVQDFDGMIEYDKSPTILEELAQEGALNKNRFKGEKRSWLDSLDEKFPSAEGDNSRDFRRWDRHVRDQFIILGMIAQRENGVDQGEIARSGLGIVFKDEASRRYAANVVRAAKIALTRLAQNQAGIKAGIFATSQGHGLRRIHMFEDEAMRELTLRWLATHPARILIPNVPE